MSQEDSNTHPIEFSKKKSKKCCICGPVKNCEPYLDRIFSNIEKIGKLFDDYVIIMYYDKSNINGNNMRISRSK